MTNTFQSDHGEYSSSETDGRIAIASSTIVLAVVI